MASEKSVFEVLNSINVNEHVEKKNNLSYLSWAWAWAEVKKVYPLAKYTIYENADGWNYFTDGRTCWVKTGVEIEGIECIEYLPVMDFKNKSIPIDNVTSFDVNKTIQRSLTKALARHGLGLYIYAGEDLPEQEVEQKKSNDKKAAEVKKEDVLKEITELLKSNEVNIEFVLQLYGVAKKEDLTITQMGNIIKNIDRIKAKQEGETKHE